MTPYFARIVVQCKSIPDNDWRSFLNWADPEEMIMYEIRGYGNSAGAAADDAFRRFNEDPYFYVEDQWPWKDEE